MYLEFWKGDWNVGAITHKLEMYFGYMYNNYRCQANIQ